MSAILSTDDLNDFISPGVACIKPIETIPANTSTTDDFEVSFNTDTTAPPPPAQISLTDCLACSGCVTSAEAILVSLQSHAEVLAALDSAPALQISRDGNVDNLDQGGRIYIASVSPQSRASIAASFGVSSREAGFMIEQLLSGPKGIKNRAVYRNSFHWVLDTNMMREVCLLLGADEAMESTSVGTMSDSRGHNSNESLKKPILTSSCPGWVCYAEKTHPYVLPHLSRLKSPQALTGTLVKSVLSRKLNISPNRIWHVAIMPCFDKKLEASREELTDVTWAGSGASGIRDVDSVITSKELLMLAESRQIQFSNLPRCPVPFIPFPDTTINSFLFSNSPKHSPCNSLHEAGTSGGYLFYILNRYASKHEGATIHTSRGRNIDVMEFSVISSAGNILFRAARYYGFRNIQNLVRRLKPAVIRRLEPARADPRPRKTPSFAYDYVEVMACPGGCTNGGGQIKEEEARAFVSQREPRAWLAAVDEAYFSADEGSDTSVADLQSSASSDDSITDLRNFLAHWSATTGIDTRKLVYTTFREVSSDVGKESAHSQQITAIAGKAGGGW
ncbi:iron-sulfur cluster assembly associated protein Nar1 [Blumeria hordei DH14]|uniref:Nuclear architecture-related protein 1 n=1 Tax=Blumeria graminis f. sp. hordei (strain DH14) TaxID=546991 RepID=N1JI42_BLUG1|nr:iron-sulfur cluster assembly associated protein Nar1 [Blumeria hordei DH14]